ncbi:glycosyltransferase family 9 protein [Mucilaginibacter sp. BT774]|uniref:glycosyltransferase family 9 protein n=1 Tax=Mucilaginibacter sp. BT774 TaxID=3062276 RepID=UPI002674EBD5|nr:glycosyltransferase family 9 protein [Mucilaginibacter sp. BT774]MDO3625953.1 glycosyltransferase family 9 protein [Mucilaginibacter sp. BT774]
MKILIRLPNWLGDVVMSTAFVGAVKQLYPDAVVDVIIKKELGGIASLIPGLNKIHLFSKQEYPGLSGVYRFGKTLQIEEYDLFFCLPDSLSSAVMGWATEAKKRIGFGKEGRFFLMTSTFKKPANLHRTDEYVSLLEQFTGNKITERSVRLRAKMVENDGNQVVLNFNSEAVSRRMPLDKGKQLINTLTNVFKNTRFVMVGSPKEKAYIDELLSGTENGQIENYAGKTNLEALCSLMASSKAVLTTDSGPAHLANSLGVPTIVLFGAGNELNTAPYNKEHLKVIRAGKLECEPCVRNTCKLYGIPKCMQLIDEPEIINALSLYL